MLCATEALATQSDARYLGRMADGSTQELQREASRYSGYSALAFNSEVFADICERVARGEVLSAICSEPGAPSPQTVYRWAESSPDARNAYTRAREDQAHTFASKVVQEAYSTTDAQIGRLRVDALKWTASKLAPRHYGDNLQVRHADADGQKLDTGPRVAELLALMQPGANTQAPAELIDVTPRVLTRVAESDTRAGESDVSDLV